MTTIEEKQHNARFIVVFGVDPIVVGYADTREDADMMLTNEQRNTDHVNPRIIDRYEGND